MAVHREAMRVGVRIMGDAEIGHNRASGFPIEENVVRLDVAMYHPAGVGVRQTPGHLAQHAYHLYDRLYSALPYAVAK